MKRIISGLLCGLLMAGLSMPAQAESVPDVSAHSAVLMEAESGCVIFEKEPDEKMLIASTTKIMTALVVLEHCDLDETVVIDPAWTGIEGSSMYLKAGQELTVRDILYGLMLASGNDAAVALACITAGSVEKFAVLMNEKAESLGCENTHFVNPNGLDADGHYSTARDLAIITRAAIENMTFREIVSTQSKTIGEQTYTNHNRLLRECEGVFGVKTGYTEAAGRSLVTCCERDGLTFICVTISAPDDWNDHKALYSWAYDLWMNFTVLHTDDAWTIPVVGGVAEEVSVAPVGELTVFCRQGEEVTLSLQMPSFVYADVKAGENAGLAVASLEGKRVASVSLAFCESIEKLEEEDRSFWQRLGDVFQISERNIYTLS